MVGYLIGRVLLAAFTVWALSVVCFAVIQLPFRVHEGFDATFVTQYLRWVGGIVQGSWGYSREYRRPVVEVIGDRAALTVVVAVLALAVTWALALPAGVFVATRPHSPLAHLVTFVGMLGLAVPHVVLALVVLYCGYVYFDADLAGLVSPELRNAPWSWEKAADVGQRLPLPVLVLALAPTAQAIRVLRANLLDEIGKPYVVTALAKGMPARRAVLKYPLRVALNPFASTVGQAAAGVVSGAMVVEMVLDLPTLGPVLLKALLAQDQHLAGTIVLITGVIAVAGTLVSDLLLVWIDPRIRLGR